MFNRIILIGRLTRDPELKYTTNTGIALAKFTLAVDRPFSASRKDAAPGAARREKETDFIRIVCWGKLAELCKQHLGRGRLVAIEGRLEVRNWETPQGERRVASEVRADDVRFLDKAPMRDGDGGGGGYSDHEQYDDGDDGHSHAPTGGRPMDTPQPGGRKDFGKYDNKKIDEEIDLDDDDPYKEDF
ncbi:MAG: single-stranded DNA-binding protein [bacterium]